MFNKDKYIEMYIEEVYNHIPGYLKMDYMEYLNDYRNKEVEYSKEDIKKSYDKLGEIAVDIDNTIICDIGELEDKAKNLGDEIEDLEQFEEDLGFCYSFWFTLESYKKHKEDILKYLNSIFIYLDVRESSDRVVIFYN